MRASQPVRSLVIMTFFAVTQATAQSLRPFVITTHPARPQAGNLASAEGRVALRDWKEADSAAAAQPDSFAHYVRLARTDGAAVAALAPTNVFANAAVLARKSSDAIQLALVLSELRNTDERHSADTLASRLADRAAQLDSEDAGGTDVQVFAEGNLKGVATGTSTQAQNGTGALGLQVRTPSNMQWSASVNVAATRDTVSAAFGENILLTGLGTNGLALLGDVRLPPLHLTVASSRLIWSLKGQVVDTLGKAHDSTFVVPATVLGADLGFFYSPLPHQAQDTVGLSFEAGASVRYASGFEDDTLVASALTRQLGSSRRTFVGVYGGLQITFGAVTSAARISYFPCRRARGICDVQLTAGVSVNAPVFSKHFVASP